MATGGAAPMTWYSSTAHQLSGGKEAGSAQAARARITLELNANLVPVLRELAHGLGISTASAADVLLVYALERWAKEELEFDGYLAHPLCLWLGVSSSFGACLE